MKVAMCLLASLTPYIAIINTLTQEYSLYIHLKSLRKSSFFLHETQRSRELAHKNSDRNEIWEQDLHHCQHSLKWLKV